MVALTLERLGIFIGRDLGRDNREDHEFITHKGIQDIFTSPGRKEELLKYIRHISSVIESRNIEHELWAWKDPISIMYIGYIFSKLQTPHVIFVTRDPIAASQREMLAEPIARPAEHILLHTRNKAYSYLSTVEFIASFRPPTLFVSYERSLAHPGEFAKALADFVGKPADAALLAWAAAHIRPQQNYQVVSEPSQSNTAR